MSPDQRAPRADAQAEAATLENQLAATLTQSADELDHAECFDPEERSELYSILKTLIDDTEAHREWIGRYVASDAGKAPNA